MNTSMKNTDDSPITNNRLNHLRLGTFSSLKGLTSFCWVSQAKNKGRKIEAVMNAISVG